MNRILLSAAVAVAMTSVSFGAELKSGPQPGQSVAAFNPLNVTGNAAGQKACQV